MLEWLQFSYIYSETSPNQPAIGQENFGQFKWVARLQRLMYNSRYHWGISDCDQLTEVGQYFEGLV